MRDIVPNRKDDFATFHFAGKQPTQLGLRPRLGEEIFGQDDDSEIRSQQAFIDLLPQATRSGEPTPYELGTLCARADFVRGIFEGDRYVPFPVGIGADNRLVELKHSVSPTEK